MRGLIFLFACLLLAIPCGAEIIYVDEDAPGANDGSSWGDAYNYLQDALDDANSIGVPVEIRVAEGIYTPDSNSADPSGSGDRTATFQLINSVAIRGGYAGFGEPDPNARDVELYETILSGDLDGNDIDIIDINHPWDLLTEPTRGENSYHVLTGSGTNATAVLDGFTITAGNANALSFPPSPAYDRGGGVFIGDGSPSLTSCTLRENAADIQGGGIVVRYGSPTLTGCTFSRNSVRWWGGGMYNLTGSPSLTNCTFIRNSAECGGGVCNYSGDLTLTNCTFSKNSAFRGGGMDNNDGASTLINCLFSGNTAGEAGGFFNSSGGSPTLANCTFSGNSAGSGGGIYTYIGSPTLTNCILWGDVPEEIYVESSRPMITYSDIQGGWPGEGNIDADPCFADPGYWDANGTPEDANDDFWV